MQTLRNQPVRDTYAAFHFVSLARTGKKFQTVKLGFSSCVLHAGNVISSRYPHVTSFVGDSQQFPRICTLSYLYTREGVRDMMRRVRSPIYMRILVHEFAHVYNVFLAAFGSKLFESFIRRDSLLTRREKLDAGEARWNVGARITGAFSMPVDQKNGKQSRSRAQGCWKFEF